ncbi:LysR family transcriptional regulator [Bacillus sp. PR5]|nr:LysR family transcriptional regulator [Bacillus sp. PR5]
MPESLNRIPSLNALRAFEVASRHLNFRAAAEELGVTQGAVSQHIRGLEAEIGLKLFERLPKSLALTGEGRSYAADIRRAFELIKSATRDLRPQPIHLTVSVTPTFASKWLIPLLPEFTQQHPEINLQILATDRLSNFHNDNVDVAIRYGNPPFGTGMTAELLFEQEIIAVCSPRLVPEGQEPVDTEELGKFTLLHDVHNLWPEFIETFLSGGDAAGFRGVTFSQTSHAIEAAIAGHGLALASRYFVARDIEEGRLRQVLSGHILARAHFYFVRQRYRKSESIDKLQAWMLSKVSS